MRRPTRARASSRLRPATLAVDLLEARQLLSTTPAGPTASPTFDVTRLVSNTSPPSGAYTPAQIKQAYGFSSVSGDGTGETIAIVDAYSDPNIQSDLNAFDAPFGLANTTVTQVNENGGTSLPGTDSSGGWELEESLDVEWAHAIAPGAKIVLVAANSANDSDLLTAVDYAKSVANVVSMSWGGGEYSSETGNDSAFTTTNDNVAFVASSGDNGAPASWPATSPNVLAVGGTSLRLSGGSYSSESGWSGSGGGPSAYESQPAYQSGVVTQTTKRANPDVAYDADPNTGFAVYDSFNYNGASYGWMQIGGTSAGAPQWAALIAIADQGRSAGLSTEAAAGSAGVQAILYANAKTEFHDITSGMSTGSPQYSAGTGYDYVTGIGSPEANLVIPTLNGGTGGTGSPSDTLVISASSSSATAGAADTVTVTARKNGATDTGFSGTVALSSSDGKIQNLPSSVTLSGGTATFTVEFGTAGSESLTATDSAINATASTTVTVSPAAPTGLTASAASSSQINLSWTAGAGDTGYSIQESTNGSTWTQAGTSTGTTFSATGLAAGTKYYFQVVGTGGGLSSAASGTASASTLTATSPPPPAASNTLFGSTIPSENGYGSGSYDLGVKFTSSSAGTVTGVRFFKQTWMSGYTHVGYLWSSTGQLLASATFTGESSSGWQSVTFSNSVSITAGTTYIVSFSSGGGYFGGTSGYTYTPVSGDPIQALNTSGGIATVYGSGTRSAPTTSYAGENFWVDVTFSPTASASVAHAAPAGGTTGLVAPTGGSTGGPSAAASVSTAPRPSPAPVQVTTVVPQAATLSSFRRGLFGGFGI